MSTERYNRHSLVDWFDQKEISACTVLVVGAGAIGNEVLKNLCLLGIGKLHVVDFDRIEEHNLTRTILFKATDIGKLKAEAAAEACKQIDPNVQVTFDTRDIWHSMSIDSLKVFDAVLCCVDNLEARIRLNQLCTIAQVDLFNAGIDSRNVSVQMFPFRGAESCSCYECWLPPSAYATMRRRYSCGWLRRIAYQEKKIPTTAITASVAGAHMVSLFLQSRCNHPDRLRGSTNFLLDTITLSSSVLPIGQSEFCPTCSRFKTTTHVYRTKRQCLATQTAPRFSTDDFTVYLSDPIVLGGQCQVCGKEVKVCDVAEKFDEKLSWCDECQKDSNALRIVDSLSFRELLAAFEKRPLPVKFLHFNHNNEQHLFELED